MSRCSKPNIVDVNCVKSQIAKLHAKSDSILYYKIITYQFAHLSQAQSSLPPVKTKSLPSYGK